MRIEPGPDPNVDALASMPDAASISPLDNAPSRREFIKAGSTAALALTLGTGLARPSPAYAAFDPMANAVYAYVGPTTSFFPGQEVQFHAYWKGQAAQLQVEITRVGYGTPTWTSSSFPITATTVPSDAYAAGCGWPTSLSFTIPATPVAWQAGVYAAMFRNLTDPTAAPTTIGFVVKSPAGGRTLFCVPTATTQAYLAWGGAGLYVSERLPTSHPAAPNYIKNLELAGPKKYQTIQVSSDRPAAGWPPPNSISYDPLSYTKPVQFLNSLVGDYYVNFCTSEDLHTNTGGFLGLHSLLLSVGHDEYWSKEMRDNVEAFISAGGNAIFAANTCWWQIRYERRAQNRSLISASDIRSIVCFKHEVAAGSQVPGSGRDIDPMRATSPTRVTTHWDTATVNRPECRMIGTSYRDGGYYAGLTSFTGFEYIVKYPKHWLFAGTGVTAGTPFAARVLGRNGNEVDAIDVTPNPTTGLPESTGSFQQAKSFIPLAVCEVGQRLQAQGKSGGRVRGDGVVARATFGLFHRGGTVVNTGTLGWWETAIGTSVDDPQGDLIVQRITRNAIMRLKDRGPWLIDRVYPRPGGGEYRPYNFEGWTEGIRVPLGWIAAGPGGISRGPVVSGYNTVVIDATAGQTYLMEDWAGAGMDPIWCERYLTYSMRFSVSTTGPAGAGVFAQLQSLDWNGANQTSPYFATARNTLTNGSWENVEVTASRTGVGTGEGAMFRACVVLVVNAEYRATITNIQVKEVLSQAVY